MANSKKIVLLILSIVLLLDNSGISAACYSATSSLRPACTKNSAETVAREIMMQKASPVVSRIKLTVTEGKESMSQRALQMVLTDYYRAIAGKGYYVLGLATGSTPIRLYSLLVESAEKGLIDFNRIYTFNMDEYEGLDPGYTGNMTPQNPGDPNISYKAFMYKYLFGPLFARGLVTQQWIDTHVNIFDSNPDDAGKMCADYEEKIAGLGGVDTWIGGIGTDGHIAFNEPEGFRVEGGRRIPVDSKTMPDSISRRVQLVQSTIDNNSGFFEFIDRDNPAKGKRWIRHENNKLIFVPPHSKGAREITHDEALAMVPKTAFSIGIKTYKDARHQILMASGLNKAKAVSKGLYEAPDNNVALSLLQGCSNCDLIIDSQAATGVLPAPEAIYFVKEGLGFSHSSVRRGIVLAVKSAA